MIGRRVPDETVPVDYEPGDYGRYKGRVYCKTPPNGLGESFLGDLTAHDVTEHEDGTITVSPSILVTTRRNKNDEESWHGFLEKGIWRTV